MDTPTENATIRDREWHEAVCGLLGEILGVLQEIRDEMAAEPREGETDE